MKKILSIILIAVLFTACKKDIPYETGNLKNFLVVNSILRKDSLIHCSVSRSRIITDRNDNFEVADAKVTIFKNGQFLEELKETSDGEYFSSVNRVEADTEYKVVVSAKGFDTVEAKDKIPEKPDFKVKYLKEDKSLYDYNACVTINDKKGQNYYRLKVFVKEEVDNSRTKFKIKNYRTVKSKNPILNHNKVYVEDGDDFSKNVENRTAIFNDDLFNETSCDLEFSFRVGELNDYKDAKNSINIELESISKDLYLYYKTLQFFEGDDEDDPFSEPVKIHSNVNNGAGILGTVSGLVVTFPIKN